MRHLTPHGSISGVMQVKVKFTGGCLGAFLPVERLFSPLLPSFLVVASCSCFCFVRGCFGSFPFSPLLTSCKLMEGKARNGWKKKSSSAFARQLLYATPPPLPPLPPQRCPCRHIHGCAHGSSISIPVHYTSYYSVFDKEIQTGIAKCQTMPPLLPLLPLLLLLLQGGTQPRGISRKKYTRSASERGGR